MTNIIKELLPGVWVFFTMFAIAGVPATIWAYCDGAWIPKIRYIIGFYILYLLFTQIVYCYDKGIPLKFNNFLGWY